jgi:hypothetical protein
MVSRIGTGQLGKRPPNIRLIGVATRPYILAFSSHGTGPNNGAKRTLQVAPGKVTSDVRLGSKADITFRSDECPLYLPK